ncbi:MAG: HesA/MoeB/ThiF family protein [Anaerolineales bacterium]
MDEMRYERQIVIPQIGEEGQARLGEARVLIIGAGGLGSPIALYLAAAGVGTLGLADPDQVSVSNLNRQILYTTDDVGRDKTAAAAERLRALNPEIEVATYPAEIRSEGGPDLAAEYDLVVEACDALASKALVNEICVAAQTPLIWAAVSRFEGQLGVYVPGHACRACVFPQTPEPGEYPAPAELGIVGAAAGVMGSLEAVEAIKVLLDIGEPFVDAILLWQGLTGVFERVEISRNPDCRCCS